MYRNIRNGAYYGMSAGLGDIPPQYQPATDAQVAGWCTARGVPDGYCPFSPGMIDYSGMLHLVVDPTGVPCNSQVFGGPCSLMNNVAGTNPAILQQLGISLFPIGSAPGASTPRAPGTDGDTYYPLSSHPNAAQLTQAQAIALLTALFGSSTPPPPPSQNPQITGVVTPPAQSTITVVSDPTTAATIASQIAGATVQPTTDGNYAVVAPGYGTTLPSVVAAIPSQPAPGGTAAGSVPIGTTPPTSQTIAPAGNSQALPPSSMFCFPGDTSGPIMTGVPVCQYTAIGALAALVLLAVALR